ncbi:MAG: undecaprenyldiphospho-muramoylpentapeptide beta-N-acetylglucosaminyltransferase [Candidatus Melainabacteria bacterium]|jgi:UDP-N-acetylglucosamine--N-acetylmuramyl-(pentapeptide) pyrophosphoryl-undecaprenol N-acetylglucosamine transferase|nr:undecaprenyldiphospho-muramoylpentapeptide beta-N-acetylglucosaminyltransferase [Candidatus Melainabacteria bacterium]
MSETEHRLILTGGGTGGHVYPALAVADELKDDPSVKAILYIGAKGHLEERLAKERGLDFVGFHVSGMPRSLSPKLFSWPLEMAQAIGQCSTLFGKFKPTAVLGTGGYASAPPLSCAATSGIPYAVHEPDAHPGLVNRFYSKRASIVSCGMESAVQKLKSKIGETVFNGNPVGKGFVTLLERERAARQLGLVSHLPTLLVTGGSQGAQAINQALFAALPALFSDPHKMQIVHQVGDNNFHEYKEQLPKEILDNARYCYRAYFDDLSIAYALCDLAVSRAGAMTISELCVTATPSIFIPYPFAAQNHQEHNARALEAKGAAAVVLQKDLNPGLLASTVKSILFDKEKLGAMKTAIQQMGKPNAAADIADQLKSLSAAYQN